MGFLDLFGGGKGRLAKHIARARNKDAQSADRFSSLEVLRDDGSPEAVEGLLSRFTIRYDKSIEDEQEKQFVFDELTKMGSAILPPLQKHLRNAESISWGLKVLHEVAAGDAAWPILADLCERNDNTYTRDPSKKIQLLVYLGEQSDPRAVKALVPYLTDMDEGVRFVTVEALLRHKDAETAREPLLHLLTNEKEESRRIKRRIVDGFADLGWDVKGFSGTVEKMLADLLPGARLDNHGKIKRKQA
ncbi:MAG TPA: HEAT repeat domain-containing protein [Polyangia bacterium]